MTSRQRAEHPILTPDPVIENFNASASTWLGSLHQRDRILLGVARTDREAGHDGVRGLVHDGCWASWSGVLWPGRRRSKTKKWPAFASSHGRAWSRGSCITCRRLEQWMLSLCHTTHMTTPSHMVEYHSPRTCGKRFQCCKQFDKPRGNLLKSYRTCSRVLAIRNTSSRFGAGLLRRGT